MRPFTQKLLADLRWSDLLRHLASRTQTELGRARAQRRPFLEDAEAIELEVQRGEELARLIREEAHGLPLGGILDIGPIAARAAKGGVIEAADLAAAARVMRELVRLRDFVETRRERLPLAWLRAEPIAVDLELARRIERSFDSAGALLDEASPALGELRARVRGLTRNIKSKLDELLREPAFSQHLRDGYYSLRNDRYVFPVLAQSRSSVPGIVHNASQSGQTLFIEPAPLVSIGNELAIALSMVAEEERRILQELSFRLGSRAVQLDESLASVALLDECQAAAKLAIDLEAAPVRAVAPGAPFRLLAMRHPLLALQKPGVVANDLEFSEAARVLVISGPNAGGKTVTLTGIGLCALMLRAGLSLPVERGSTLPLFEGIESAVGDAQDLSRDLSTFSAHLTALREIGAVAGPGTLILIDELAADTDPREGAALALAVLESFSSKGARVVITTHLEELKALGLVDAAFVNARVGFDGERMAPTYRLKFGEPGASSAIEIARRVGLPESICARAQACLSSRQGPLGQALDALGRAREALNLEKANLEAERRALEAARLELAKARQTAESRAREIETTAREALVRDIEQAREDVRALVAKLQAAPAMRTAVEAQQVLQARQVAAEQRIELDKARDETPREEQLPGAKIAVGMRVKVPGMGSGEVLSIEGEVAVVALGALKLRRRCSDVIALRSAPAPRAFPKSKKSEERLEKVSPGALGGSALRLDLRGMRVDEALRCAETFLDRSFGEGLRSVTFVHGHGTGALRQAIGELLAASPYVQSFRRGEDHEGGSGVTVVMLLEGMG